MADSRDTRKLAADTCAVTIICYVYLHVVIMLLVFKNMPPDPSRQAEKGRASIDDTYLTGTVNNTENDDDDISYEGYEILPQDFNESNAEPEDIDVEDSNSEEEEDAASFNIVVSNFDTSVKIELTELWNSPDNTRLTAIAMDSKKEEEIKNAMASFVLPSTSIPMWAKNIPEEQWKQQILNKLNSSNRN